MRMTGVRVTPVAAADPPLRNSWGVHAPYMLRNIIEMDTDEGIVGISMAAMVHLAACTPLLIYACDTHYPWQTEDVIKGGKLRFVDGTMAPPDRPGLGVEIDRDRLAALHENHRRFAGSGRDDTAEMRKRDPYYLPMRPRW